MHSKRVTWSPTCSWAESHTQVFHGTLFLACQCIQCCSIFLDFFELDLSLEHQRDHFVVPRWQPFLNAFSPNTATPCGTITEKRHSVIFLVPSIRSKQFNFNACQWKSCPFPLSRWVLTGFDPNYLFSFTNDIVLQQFKQNGQKLKEGPKGEKVANVLCTPLEKMF